MNKIEAINLQQTVFDELDIHEIAVVKNPEYIYSPIELYPLASKNTRPLSRLVACVMDMDGTTTTTEPLCIHSQEFMIRKITGMLDKSIWSGFDEKEDYPNIIGNSTTKHVEYLIGKYINRIMVDRLLVSFIESVIWTYVSGQRFGRWNEVRQNVIVLGLSEILNDLKGFSSDLPFDCSEFAGQLYDRYRDNCLHPEFNMLVRMAIDIYYARYHHILSLLQQDKPVNDEFLTGPAQSLIEPMTGVAFFLALLKGWFDKEEVEELFDPVLRKMAAKSGLVLPEGLVSTQKLKLMKLADYFKVNPVKLALVTSSIASEAEIVLTEVMKAIRKEIEVWPLSHLKKSKLIGHFINQHQIYDAVITANDSSEIRLKPHRDLYSIALYQMAVKKEDYQYVIGCEDSESGIIAIRAAGIGCSIALPFKNTENHKFWAASHVLPRALPELVLIHNCNLEIKE